MTWPRREDLSRYFEHISFKRLTRHEVDPRVSNGHEFQGVSTFRELFGSEKREFSVEVIYLSTSAQKNIRRQPGSLTWYNARENNPKRSPEFRLYYKSDLTLIQEYAAPGDACFIAKVAVDSPLKKTLSCDLVLFIAQSNTDWEQQLRWLFGVKVTDEKSTFIQQSITGKANRKLEYSTRHLLEELGIPLRQTSDSLSEQLIKKYSDFFPKTFELSQIAAGLVEPSLLREEPDQALLLLMEREEELFKALEAHHVQKRLGYGFGNDVEQFISYSLSVQNRRKSRAGHALEHHISRILEAHEVSFIKNFALPDGSRPDFLFPGKAMAEPADSGFHTMLGAKSTCKDRWRQVLAEAKAISEKYLLTLEPAISEPQTAEMQASRLQLVVPKPLHSSYSDAQTSWLFSFMDFINLVKEKQS